MLIDQKGLSKTMNDRRLKTACIGLGQRGAEILDAVSQSGDIFEIIAVADRNPESAEQIERKYDCKFYDDYRQLIIQNDADLLIVAAPLHSCIEHVKVAIKKKINILKLPPLATNFEDGLELLKLAKNEKVEFCVANGFRFTKSFLDLRKYISNNMLEHIYFIQGTFTTPKTDTQEDQWSSDPKLSGGGVLLNNCYEFIDQLLLNFSMPQQIYSLKTNQARDLKQRLSITEDTAVVNMKFGEALIANIVASRAFGPSRQELRVYGSDRFLEVSPRSFNIYDSFGRPIEQKKYEQTEGEVLKQLVCNFGKSLLFEDEVCLCGNYDENMNIMSLIESAYLSSNTGMPEDPGKIYKLNFI